MAFPTLSKRFAAPSSAVLHPGGTLLPPSQNGNSALLPRDCRRGRHEVASLA